MIIQANIPATVSYNSMKINSINTDKTMEKLSSGLRINRASDDAAGLAISEKMRSQVRGLQQAGKNIQDGISLIQVGDGALSETHSTLQRMRELSVQAANGIYTDSDRENIQKEIDQLKCTVNDIANNTEFNTRPLLNSFPVTNNFDFANPTAFQIPSVISFVNEQFVASDMSGKVKFSSDGKTWTDGTQTTATKGTVVTYSQANDKYIAINGNVGGANAVQITDDPINGT